MLTLADRLAAVRHRHLNLADTTGRTDTNCHRPNMSIWPDSMRGEIAVNLTLDQLYGQQWRCVAMSPAEARLLACHLIKCADEAEHIKGRLAADEVKDAGGSALDAAKAQITATFGG